MGPGSSGKVPLAVLSAASSSSSTRGTRGGGPMATPALGGHPRHLRARAGLGGAAPTEHPKPSGGPGIGATLALCHQQHVGKPLLVTGQGWGRGDRSVRTPGQGDTGTRGRGDKREA